jgi:hypothetical protein
MKADLRISVKGYRWDKNLKNQLVRVPFNAVAFCAKYRGGPVELGCKHILSL